VTGHDAQRTAWVLSNGLVGMDNQSIGLAEALGLDYTVKHLVAVAPWKYLPPSLWYSPLNQLGEGSDKLVAPWPDAVIGTGRLTVAASIAIRRASDGRTANIRIQHPRTNFSHFDVIVAPQHDQCKGKQVIETLGAVNRMTHERLNGAAERFLPRYSHLPRPYIALLMGGNNSQYTLDKIFAQQLARKLSRALQDSGGSLLVTPSRRTDPVAVQVLRENLSDYPVEIWDGTGENPYFAYLGLADYVVVTADSVNMASEACYTGKPVFIEGLTGQHNKFEHFHRSLQQQGCTRPFTGALSSWQYTPLNETYRAAQQIKHVLGW
jgi:mitochondrial fission protein ELM1